MKPLDQTRTITPAQRSVPRQLPPSLLWERRFWDAGLPFVAGIDEVGRGALAGPLVAAAVVFPCVAPAQLRALRATLRGVRDSKRLEPETRIRLAIRIERVASAVAIGAVPSWEIDAIGLAAANRLAMERAVWGLPHAPAALLIDACTIDYAAPQVGLIRGDAASLSIAAASVIAKVARDQMMDDLHYLDGRYHFVTHKGYGTTRHLAALVEHGPSSVHRFSFAPVAILQ